MKTIYAMLLVVLFASCAVRDESDAWGNFEAEETILSARIAGNITELGAEEGEDISAGDRVAVIDTTDLVFSKAELKSNIALLDFKIQAAVERQKLSSTEKANLAIEQERFIKLLSQNASTQKQVDDIAANMRLLDNKAALAKTEIAMAKAEKSIAQAKLGTLQGNIDKCYVTSQTEGTVLSTYAREGEFVAIGKPILKLANLKTLRAVFFISGNQLSQIRTGQEITLRVDGAKGLKNYSATVSYISDKAEFTPKIVQTRDERTKLVYRVEALCSNDGSLKQGMPLEVVF